MWIWLVCNVFAAEPAALGPVAATARVGLQVWRVISLADGARCSYRPTCSAFAARAVQRDGVLGIPLALDRLVRESAAQAYPLAADHVHRRDPVGDHVRLVDLFRGCRADRRAGAGACAF